MLNQLDVLQRGAQISPNFFYELDFLIIQEKRLRLRVRIVDSNETVAILSAISRSSITMRTIHESFSIPLWSV